MDALCPKNLPIQLHSWCRVFEALLYGIYVLYLVKIGQDFLGSDHWSVKIQVTLIRPKECGNINCSTAVGTGSE